MKLIFGIGNPGREYIGTRHNIGYYIIDEISREWKIKLRPGTGDWLIGTNRDVIFIKSLVWVNLSGTAAKDIFQKYTFPLEQFLVICDDFSLPIGKARLRRKGSSGGHKGLESIIYCLETENFPRLRIGTGPLIGDAVDFVLSRFTKEEEKIIKGLIPEILTAIDIFIKDGIEKAMSYLN